MLASLCSNNAVVVKFVLSSLRERDRRLFFAQEADGIKVQVLVDFLNHCLCRATLATSPPVWQNFESRLARICDAFLAAYADGDYLLMEFYTGFLAEGADKDKIKVEKSEKTTPRVLSERSEGTDRTPHHHEKSAKGGGVVVSDATLVSLMQQVLLGTDCCGDDDNLSSESTFSFLRALFSHMSDLKSAAAMVSRAVLPRLESAAGESAQAVRLAQDLIARASTVARPLHRSDSENDKENANFATCDSLQEHISPIVSALCQMVNSTCSPSGQAKTTRIHALESLVTACKSAQEWGEVVARQVKPAKLADVMSDHEDLLAPYVLLLKTLSDNPSVTSSVRSECRKLADRADTKKRLVSRLRGDSCRKREERHILGVLDGQFDPFWDESDEAEDDLCLAELRGSSGDMGVSPEEAEAVGNADALVEKLTQHMEQNQA